MKKVRRAWGAAASDATPHGYLSARWRLGEGWRDVVAAGAVDVVTSRDVLARHEATVQQLCSLVGVVGLTLLMAPQRPAPAYWLEVNAGINAPSSKLHGCTEHGADSIVCEIVGVGSRDCTASVEGRLRDLLCALHCALAAAVR